MAAGGGAGFCQVSFFTTKIERKHWMKGKVSSDVDRWKDQTNVTILGPR